MKRSWTVCVCLATLSVLVLIMGQVHLLAQPHFLVSEIISTETTTPSLESSISINHDSEHLVEELNQINKEKRLGDEKILELEIELSSLKRKSQRGTQNQVVRIITDEKYKSQCRKKYKTGEVLTISHLVERILHDSNTIKGASNDILILGVGHSGTSSVAKMFQWYIQNRKQTNMITGNGEEYKQFDDDQAPNSRLNLNLNTWKVEMEAGQLGEDRRVNYLNEKVLATTHIDKTMTIHLGGSVSIDELARNLTLNEDIKKVITNSSYAIKLWEGYSRPCLWKDPRFVWTLHLWLPIFLKQQSSLPGQQLGDDINELRIEGSGARDGGGSDSGGRESTQNRNILSEITDDDDDEEGEEEEDDDDEDDLVDYSLPILLHVTRNPLKIQKSHLKRLNEAHGLGMSLKLHVENKMAWAQWQLEHWIANHGRYFSFDISSIVENMPHINQKEGGGKWNKMMTGSDWYSGKRIKRLGSSRDAFLLNSSFEMREWKKRTSNALSSHSPRDRILLNNGTSFSLVGDRGGGRMKTRSRGGGVLSSVRLKVEERDAMARIDAMISENNNQRAAEGVDQAASRPSW